jgi:hypothetical protein
VSIHYAETPYGFEYGAAKVVRCASSEKTGWVAIDISTKKGTYQVYVTKTGKVRVFHPTDGEMKPLAKEPKP